MARSKLRMSPAVEQELEDVREAAEYAASHPLGHVGDFVIRGYVRHNGQWYVEALRENNPDPLVMQGDKLVELVREAKSNEDEGHEV